jgi:nitrate/TMAO reductase-like tetraheme cytochrome c subunit
MKGIILFVLLTVTVALYLGYGPYDLVLLVKPTTSAPAVKHAHVATEQATGQTPVPRNTSVIVAEAPDGSLDHRWPKTVATSTPSPVKQ